MVNDQSQIEGLAECDPEFRVNEAGHATRTARTSRNMAKATTNPKPARMKAELSSRRMAGFRLLQGQ